MTTSDAARLCKAIYEAHQYGANAALIQQAESAQAAENAEAEAEMRAAMPSAAKALEAAVQAYGIAPGPPEAQALALAQKGLWPESWDGGETWHEEGNKEKALPAALVEAELAAKAAVEAQNLEMFGTTVPNSDKAAKFSHASWWRVPSYPV